MAGNLSLSIDIGTHYLKSVIELKYCLSELIIADLLRKLPTAYPDCKYKPSERKLSLSDNVKSLCYEVKKIHPEISTRDSYSLTPSCAASSATRAIFATGP